MARNCDYEHQLRETCRLVAEEVGIAPERLGARLPEPERPAGRSLARARYPRSPQGLTQRGVTDVVIHPVGFLSDHMEVLYDLDEEARHLCDALGLTMVRSQTVGMHPASSRCSAS